MNDVIFNHQNNLENRYMKAIKFLIKYAVFAIATAFATTLLQAQSNATEGDIASGNLSVSGITNKTVMNYPLPDGEWTLSNTGSTKSSTGQNFRFHYLFPKSSKIGTESKKLEIALYLSTFTDDKPINWNNEPCKGEFIYKNDYGTKLWDQRCLTIYEGSFLTSSNTTQNQIRNYLENQGIEFQTSGLYVKYTQYNRRGRFIELSFVIFPQNYQLEAPLVGASSTWNTINYSKDPAKVKFIEALKQWAEKYVAAVDKNFSEEKLPGIRVEKFTYKNANFDGQKAPSTIISAKDTVRAEASKQNEIILTSPPIPVPPQGGQPARAAAIGNVAQPPATIAQSTAGQVTQLTSNPIDNQKKTSNNEVWVSFNPSITVQERQFCRIIENFRTENNIAQLSRNQIKVNETFRNLSQALNALLPDGKFQSWIMRTVYVSQAIDGSAEVLLELPCNVYVGSNACDANPQNFYGTAPEGSRIYTELAKMSVGDFALTSGQFVYTDANAYDRSRSVASFRFIKTAQHCRASEMQIDSDFFGLKLDVISTIK
jgi:hypothetical protein